MSKLLEKYQKSIFSQLGQKVENIKSNKKPASISSFQTNNIIDANTNIENIIIKPFSNILNFHTFRGDILINPANALLELFKSFDNDNTIKIESDSIINKDIPTVGNILKSDFISKKQSINLGIVNAFDDTYNIGFVPNAQFGLSYYKYSLVPEINIDFRKSEKQIIEINNNFAFKSEKSIPKNVDNFDFESNKKVPVEPFEFQFEASKENQISNIVTVPFQSNKENQIINYLDFPFMSDKINQATNYSNFPFISDKVGRDYSIVNVFGDEYSIGFIPNARKGETHFTLKELAGLTESNAFNDQYAVGFTSNMRLGETQYTMEGLATLGVSNVFSDQYAVGFTPNMRLGETNYTMEGLATLGVSNVFSDQYAVGFTPNMRLGETQYTMEGLAKLGESDVFDNRYAIGFIKNARPLETHYTMQGLDILSSTNAFENIYNIGFTINAQQGITEFNTIGLNYGLNTLSNSNVFSDQYAVGFTPNMRLGETQYTMEGLATLGISNVFSDQYATGFTPNMRLGETNYTMEGLATLGASNVFSDQYAVGFTPNMKLGETNYTMEGLATLGISNVFSDQYATGFTPNMRLGETNYTMEGLAILGASNVFSDQYAVGFTPNMRLGETQYTMEGLATLGVSNVFSDQYATGFTPNMRLGETQYTMEGLGTISNVNTIIDKYNSGFTINSQQGITEFNSTSLNYFDTLKQSNPYPSDFIINLHANGFTLNATYGDTQFSELAKNYFDSQKNYYKYPSNTIEDIYATGFDMNSSKNETNFTDSGLNYIQLGSTNAFKSLYHSIGGFKLNAIMGETGFTELGLNYFNNIRENGSYPVNAFVDSDKYSQGFTLESTLKETNFTPDALNYFDTLTSNTVDPPGYPVNAFDRNNMFTLGGFSFKNPYSDKLQTEYNLDATPNLSGFLLSLRGGSLLQNIAWTTKNVIQSYPIGSVAFGAVNAAFSAITGNSLEGALVDSGVFNTPMGPVSTVLTFPVDVHRYAIQNLPIWMVTGKVSTILDRLRNTPSNGIKEETAAKYNLYNLSLPPIPESEEDRLNQSRVIWNYALGHKFRSELAMGQLDGSTPSGISMDIDFSSLISNNSSTILSLFMNNGQEREQVITTLASEGIKYSKAGGFLDTDSELYNTHYSIIGNYAINLFYNSPNGDFRYNNFLLGYDLNSFLVTKYDTALERPITDPVFYSNNVKSQGLKNQVKLKNESQTFGNSKLFARKEDSDAYQWHTDKRYERNYNNETVGTERINHPLESDLEINQEYALKDDFKGTYEKNLFNSKESLFNTIVDPNHKYTHPAINYVNHPANGFAKKLKEHLSNNSDKLDAKLLDNRGYPSQDNKKTDLKNAMDLFLINHSTDTSTNRTDSSADLPGSDISGSSNNSQNNQSNTGQTDTDLELTEFQDDDLIDFWFKDISSHDNKDIVIPFRSIITSFNNNASANWNSIEYVGRPDKFWIYQGFERKVDISFDVAVNSRAELLPSWRKLNYLSGMVYPVEYTGNIGMKPAIMKLTVGDILNDVVVILNSFSFNLDGNTLWEIKQNFQVPMYIKVSTSFTVLYDDLPFAKSKHFAQKQGWMEPQIYEYKPEVPVAMGQGEYKNKRYVRHDIYGETHFLKAEESDGSTPIANNLDVDSYQNEV